MVPFDVSSLFTNVPLQDTVDIILQRVYDDNEVATTIPRDDMKSLLYLCTSKSCFLFNNMLYEQIDGLSMGNTLGPVMANIFMIYFESLLQERSNLAGLKHWFRYVDDIFAIFDVKPDLPAILLDLNSIHRNTNFSYEPEIDGQLHFLDVNIRFCSGKFITTTHTKPILILDCIHSGPVSHQSSIRLIFLSVYCSDLLGFVLTGLILFQRSTIYKIHSQKLDILATSYRTFLNLL